MGSPPRDEEFLRRVEALAENQMMIYQLPDPEARIAGLSQHPLQRVVRNHGDQAGKKFHTWKWLDHVYVVRLPTPTPESLDLKTPTTSP